MLVTWKAPGHAHGHAAAVHNDGNENGSGSGSGSGESESGTLSADHVSSHVYERQGALIIDGRYRLYVIRNHIIMKDTTFIAVLL